MKRIVIVLLASTSILSAQGLSSLLGGSNAKKIQGVAVKASLGCTNGQILKYVSANSQFECADDSGGSGAGDVEGGTNLTTAGAIPYVSASGTLSQDTPALHWDATNNRLGLGTASPDYPAHILGGAGTLLFVTNGTYSLSLDPSQGAFQGSANVSFLSGSSSDLFFGASSGTYKLTIKNSANSVGIGPSNTSPVGTMHVYDARATTGVTTLTVRAGAGQSTTNLQSWQNSSGTALATVSSTGGFQGANFVNSSGNIGIGSSSLVLGSAASIGFSSTTNWFGTADLGFTRSSANNLGITNGSSTTYWTLGAGGILAGTDNTYDIGASGANRPRDIWLGRNATVGNLLTVAFLNGSTDGILRLSNAAGSGFTRLQFGGTTSSFPAWSRSSTTLAARLADDSADAPISASNVSASADFIGATTSFHYWGATGSDGSWRMGLDSGNMVIQKRESGSWVTKQTIAP